MTPRTLLASIRYLRALALGAVAAGFASAAAAAPNCAALATDPAGVIATNPTIKSAASAVVPAAGGNVAYCQVNLLYGTNANQNINIAIGLPLSAADGGSGGVQGAWNGRTQGLGGGGCAGNLNPVPAVNAGYVGSGNDLGHSGGNCEPGVNADGTYNAQFIEDFIRNGIEQQVLWAKKVAQAYYDMAPIYNYWNGCSTGGRQGYLLAQELGGELDGIVANAPAIYWTRFQTAQMWGEIAMQELTGGPIAAAKLAQARASAVAACDGADGIVDGVIDDPRACHFSARANICGASTAPAGNCLTPLEADAIDRIWDGPRNEEGNRIWFGLDRGSDFGILDGANPFALGVTQFHWDEHDRNFNWQNVSLAQYPQVAQAGSRNIADVTDTFGPLDTFKEHGGKLLTFVGANDQFIYPRGVINYYRQMASRYSETGEPDFKSLQRFYRLFRAPGVGHCGIGSTGPVPVDPFGALVNWVERGVAPDSLLASGGSAAPASGRTRPICPYPQTAIYNGTGNTDEAANFHCGDNVETAARACSDVLTTYKHEVDGSLDYRGTGFDRRECADRDSEKSE
ncbi:MAG TPA: tannase/feruloyl esterase family alpha/beta hydrolase [Burkholderiaceae bacterium]|nr:tannase/feruloyl esterase family alpha/beta hydrolase [Burkholderiaceae bacterium]